MKTLFNFICLATFALGARLVVLDPASAEIIHSLGASSQIVGIAPPSEFALRMDISKIKNVGSYMKPNIEEIYALKPDLVLASRHSLASAEQLEKLGIKMRTMDAANLEQIAKNIQYLSELTNTSASALLSEFRANLAALGEQNESFKGKSALVVFSAKPLMLFCGENIITSSLSALGLKNLCDSREETPIISTEYLATKQADFIIYLNADTAALMQLPLMPQIAAKSRIVSTNASALLRASNLITQPLNELKNKLNAQAK